MSNNTQESLRTVTGAVPSPAVSSVDLDAYFQRIGYTGERIPTLHTLQALHNLHPQAIPFENLNPLLRLPVRLDMDSLQQKLVQEGRGGYCFEQNLLFSQVLQALGFRVKGLAARVLWNLPDGIMTPRGHMLLLVEIDKTLFIADVGFGGFTLTAPLRLEAGPEQATPHESFRLMPLDEDFVLQAKIKEVWKPIYRFNLQEQFLPDYEVSSWYLSNHPDSHFIKGLIVARSTPECRYVLRNTDFGTHHLSGNTERQVITDAAVLQNLLETVFQLNISHLPGLHSALQKLTGQGV
jgi:N-hydroxyarylamine O-acetyltransferase